VSCAAVATAGLMFFGWKSPARAWPTQASEAALISDGPQPVARYSESDLIQKLANVAKSEGQPEFTKIVENEFNITLYRKRFNIDGADRTILIYPDNNQPVSQFSINIDETTLNNNYYFFNFDLTPQNPASIGNNPSIQCAHVDKLNEKLKSAGFYLFEKIGEKGLDVPSRPAAVRYDYLDSNLLSNAKREIIILSEVGRSECLDHISISGRISTIVKLH
jgi:hypothetical protein